MNNFSLEPWVEVRELPDFIEITSYQELVVDGKRINEWAFAPFDLMDLHASLLESGNFWVFGYDYADPVVVECKESSVLWTLRVPVIYWRPGDPTNVPEEDRRDIWYKNVEPVTWEFSKEQIATELREAIHWFFDEGATSFSPYCPTRNEYEEILEWAETYSRGLRNDRSLA